MDDTCIGLAIYSVVTPIKYGCHTFGLSVLQPVKSTSLRIRLVNHFLQQHNLAFEDASLTVLRWATGYVGALDNNPCL